LARNADQRGFLLVSRDADARGFLNAMGFDGTLQVPLRRPRPAWASDPR
jgi:hypothetical protein